MIKILYTVLYFLFGCLLMGYGQITPPQILAKGNQIYCPQTEMSVVTNFDIIDTNNNGTEAVYIQISSGYNKDNDKLVLKGNHPNLTNIWNEVEGKLTLKSKTGGNALYTDLIEAVKQVVFFSTASSPQNNKSFSITIGNANFLPSTGHYYQFISHSGITWQNAKNAAENKTYYGLKGYLATLTTSEEAILCGEQASGTGWIGASDTQTEGTWKWVTGPEAGKTFWIGKSNGTTNGTDLPYEFWNNNEPNDYNNNEDYAHITDPSIGIQGSWNDLPNTGDLDPSSKYYPKGYIVEYGGTVGDPVLNISGSTTIKMPMLNSYGNKERCGFGNITLQATALEGNVLWFDSLQSNTPIYTGNSFVINNLQATKSYYILASANGCTSGNRIEVKAIVNSIPNTVNQYTLINCDEDGVADGITVFNLLEAKTYITQEPNVNISFHKSQADANSNSSPLNATNYRNTNSNLVYARVENEKGCFKTLPITLQVLTTSFSDDFEVVIENCENDDINDGFVNFNLNEAVTKIINALPPNQNLKVKFYHNLQDAQVEENEILNIENYQNTTPYSETLTIRVEDTTNGACYGIAKNVVLKVNARPSFLISENEILCLNNAPLTLSTYNNKNVSSLIWEKDGEVLGNDFIFQVTEAGVYTVTASSNNGCLSFPQKITVTASEVAHISENDITITQQGNYNTVEIDITNLGIGNYEYAIGSATNFQQTSIFTKITSGIKTLYVNEKNGCGLTQIDISILGYPKFFSPNNDGINDNWFVNGVSSQFYNKALVHIFDRYGKIITTINILEKQYWNGSYLTNKLPSNDYWFVALLENKNGKHIQIKGNFTLIR